jgi:hypothetical protein
VIETSGFCFELVFKIAKMNDSINLAAYNPVDSM